MTDIDKQIIADALLIPKHELAPRQIEIIKGRWCPKCNIPTEHKPAEVIYKRSGYGMIYLCPNCRAYVGCHKGEITKAKGRVADANLRTLKIEAHKYFDMIWQLGYMKRKVAYHWLALKLNIHPKYCHIGMLGEAKTKDVIYYSKQFLNDMCRLDLDFGDKPKTQYFEI